MKNKMDYVKEWISFANEDLETAELLIKNKEPITRIICFHCQQAVEKYIKACCIYKDLDFPKSHEIGELISLIEDLDKEIAEIKSEADDLTPYAISIRYPGSGGTPSIEDSYEAIEIAKHVKSLVLKKIIE